jgi:hypothetical protein
MNCRIKNGKIKQQSMEIYSTNKKSLMQIKADMAANKQSAVACQEEC